MSIRRVISFAAVAALGIACVSADAFAARVTARGGAVGARGGAVGVRGGTIGARGAVGYRGGYRPGVGLAAGALAGGAIAASSPYGYGTYGYGPNGYSDAYDYYYYGSSPSYSSPWSGVSPGRVYPGYGAASAPANSYNNYGNAGSTYGYQGSYASTGACGSEGNDIWCHGQCWLKDPAAGHWGECPAALRAKIH